MRAIQKLTVGACLAHFLFGTSQLAFAQTVENAVHFDLSPPLSTIQAPPRAQGAFLREHRVKMLPPLPTRAAAQADTVLQTTAVIALPAVVVGSVFDGVGNPNFTISSDPPDTNGSVGKSHYVQWVNTGLAIFDKATRTFVASQAD
jgi:hypothetical protein